MGSARVELAAAGFLTIGISNSDFQTLCRSRIWSQPGYRYPTTLSKLVFQVCPISCVNPVISPNLLLFFSIVKFIFSANSLKLFLFIPKHKPTLSSLILLPFINQNIGSVYIKHFQVIPQWSHELFAEWLEVTKSLIEYISLFLYYAPVAQSVER